MKHGNDSAYQPKPTNKPLGAPPRRRETSVIEWVSVRDRLPPFGQKVLVLVRCGNLGLAVATCEIVQHYDIDEGAFFSVMLPPDVSICACCSTVSEVVYDLSVHDDLVTHWAPFLQTPGGQR